MELLTPTEHAAQPPDEHTLVLANDIDPRTIDLRRVRRIDLQFPQFTDGRAHSQAMLLRRRLGYAGELRATGDVLVDLVPLLARNGFSHAVLRADQDMAAARRELTRFSAHYQGDARQRLPRFALARSLRETV
ncbi:MAG: DUF934 domain-containing protein [Hylemonella sp.]